MGDRIKKKWFRPNHYVSQFVGGHGDFRAKLQSLGLSQDDACECGQRDTPDHVLYECEQFKEEKERLE